MDKTNCKTPSNPPPTNGLKWLQPFIFLAITLFILALFATIKLTTRDVAEHQETVTENPEFWKDVVRSMKNKENEETKASLKTLEDLAKAMNNPFVDEPTPNDFLNPSQPLMPTNTYPESRPPTIFDFIQPPPIQKPIIIRPFEEIIPLDELPISPLDLIQMFQPPMFDMPFGQFPSLFDMFMPQLPMMPIFDQPQQVVPSPFMNFFQPPINTFEDVPRPLDEVSPIITPMKDLKQVLELGNNPFFQPEGPRLIPMIHETKKSSDEVLSETVDKIFEELYKDSDEQEKVPEIKQDVPTLLEYHELAAPADSQVNFRNLLPSEFFTNLKRN